MKRSVQFILLGMFIPFLVLANTSLTTQLNQRFKEILSVFNNNLTKTFLIIDDLEITPERLSFLKGKLLFSKTGERDKVSLTIVGTYDNKDSKKPTTTLEANLKANLLNLVESQKEFNEFIEGIEHQFQEIVTHNPFYALDEDAVQVQAQITRKEIDSSGNVLLLEGEGHIKVDTSKVSEKSLKEDILWTEIKFNIFLSLEEIRLKATVVANPLYKGFEKDEQGLKEWIESLLKQNSKEEDTIIHFFNQLNKYAKSALEER